MYIWNGKKLCKELAAGSLSENEKLKYFYVGSLLYVTTAYFSLYYPPETDKFYYFEYFLIFLITLAGIGICYKNHGGNSRNGFIENFVCLSVPTLIKLYLFIWLPYFLFYRFVDPVALGWPQEISYKILKVSQSSLAVSTEVFFYMLMAYFMKVVYRSK